MSHRAPPSQLKTSRASARPVLCEAKLEIIHPKKQEVQLKGSPTRHKAHGGDHFEQLRDAFNRDVPVVLAVDPHNGDVLGVYEPPKSKWEIGE